MAPATWACVLLMLGLATLAQGAAPRGVGHARAPRLPARTVRTAAAAPALGVAAAPLAALADAADGGVELPPDSLLVGIVGVLLVGAAALQFSLGDVMGEVDNLPPSMGSQAKKERLKSGGFLKDAARDDDPTAL